MKILLWILFVGNVLLFVVMRWGGLQDEHSEKEQPPMHEEKIILLTPHDNQLLSPPISAASKAEVQASAPSSPVSVKCMEWGDFSGTGLAKATAALSPLKLGDRLGRRKIENVTSYWVYIPPLKNKAAINQKISQLKERGITEYFVVSEPGPWLNAISLGVFRTKSAAQHRLDELLHKRNLQGVQLEKSANKLKLTRLLLNGLDASESASIAAIQKNFAGSALVEHSCALTK